MSDDAISLSTGSARERIVDLEQTIKGLVHWNRSISSDLQRPQRVEAEIARELATIEACQKRIERYQQNLVGGKDQIAHNDDRIASLRLEIVMLENRAKIERLVELTNQINSLTAEDMPAEAIAACESVVVDDDSDDELEPTDNELGVEVEDGDDDES